MYKLIVTDYDGTLVPNGKVLSSEFWQKIQKITSCGVKFAVSSGRTYADLKKKFSPVFPSTVFIANDGALIMYANCLLYKCTADKNGAKKICSLALKKGAKAYISQREENLPVTQMQTESTFFIGGDIFKIIIEKNGVNCEELKIVAEKYNLRTCFEDALYLEFCNRDANKGNALKVLAKKFGINKEQTVVFGDGENDISMFSFGGKNIVPIYANAGILSLANEKVIDVERYIIGLK